MGNNIRSWKQPSPYSPEHSRQLPQVIKEKCKEGQKLINNTKRSGEEVKKNASENDCKIVSQQLQQLQDEWDALIVKPTDTEPLARSLGEDSQFLKQDCLSYSDDFRKSLEEFLKGIKAFLDPDQDKRHFQEIERGNKLLQTALESFKKGLTNIQQERETAEYTSQETEIFQDKAELFSFDYHFGQFCGWLTDMVSKLHDEEDITVKTTLKREEAQLLTRYKQYLVRKSYLKDLKKWQDFIKTFKQHPSDKKTSRVKAKSRGWLSFPNDTGPKPIHVAIQLFSGQKTDMTNDAMQNLERMLERYGILVNRCNNASTIRNEGPLIILCLHSSRLYSDICSALSNARTGPNTALLIFHLLRANDDLQIKAAIQPQEVGIIIDFAFLDREGIYNCHVNKTAESKLIEFIKNGIEV